MEERVILFVCKGNSGRSQMAEAFYNSLCERGRAISAGTTPDKEIHPWTVQVMQEAGIDVAGQNPKLLTNRLMEQADNVVIMDKNLLKEINVLPEYVTKLETWDIEQLIGKDIERVKAVRDVIRKNVERLIKEND